VEIFLKVFIYTLILSLSLFASFNTFFSDKFNEIKIKKSKDEPLMAPLSFVKEVETTVAKPEPSIESNKATTEINEPYNYEPLDIEIKLSYIGYLRVKSKSFALITFDTTKMVVKMGDLVTMGKQQLMVSHIDEKKIILAKNSLKKVIYFTYKK
jgi:Tfp pilus assembly protein PilP